MSRLINLIKTEPAMITASVQALLALLVSLGFSLTAAETGAILAVTTALLALITAVSVDKFGASTLTGLVAAVVTLLIAFGVKDINPGVVATLNGTIVAIMALVLRQQVTPVASIPKPAAKAYAPPV